MNRKFYFRIAFMVAFFTIILGTASPGLQRYYYSGQSPCAVFKIFGSVPDETGTHQIEAELNHAVVISCVARKYSLSSQESHSFPCYSVATFQQRAPAFIARYLRVSTLLKSGIRDISSADRTANYCELAHRSCCCFAAGPYFLTASLATRLPNG
jgi:hypothetical protein